MEDREYAAIAVKTWEQCVHTLPTSLKTSLEIQSPDPKRFKKYGDSLDIMRLRLLPVKRAPKSFWSPKFCYYEIGIGPYDGGLCLGGVQWIQFPNQKVCGANQWLPQVQSILNATNQKRPEFQIHSGIPELTAIQQFYYAKPHKFFPSELAGKDLAWLIEETFPAFVAL